MAKKKVVETNEVETKVESEVVKEKTTKITNDKLFEGLVCLDIKLDKLISIFEKIADHIERKEKGEISPFRN